ncbi:acylphosphatase [Cellulomonas aerilata]|uniref:acylphosphatase n=1 Tax=Cellulomonas aerilata TaxID=515326 RepID=UPI001FE34C75|nr:acylphosphatase [Cellulomonas aerilata]
MIRRRAVVHGSVQGVGFRWSCAREAQRLGVDGWVRNRADGTVEALVEGDPEAVRQLLEWLHHGPRFADVSGVDVVEEDAPPGLADRPGFRVED